MIALVFLLLLSTPMQRAQGLIAQAHDLTARYGDRVWPGYKRTPFPIILVGQTNEYLYCPAGPAPTFKPYKKKSASSCAIKVRPRRFSAAMRATFPAVDGLATVVVGPPSGVDKNPAAWTATLLHEHFHQYQMGWPGYYSAVADLKLDGGKGDGRWMLDYPFSYDDAQTASAFAATARLLLGALEIEGDSNNKDFHAALTAYTQARRTLFSSLSATDARYAAFQMWQEGTARYSEIAIAESVTGPRAAIFTPLAINLRGRVYDNLRAFDLAKNKRVSFYDLGAGEALLLDRVCANWRAHYFDYAFDLGPLLALKRHPFCRR